MYNLAISVHAASGIVAFIIGLVLILQTGARRQTGLAWALLGFVALMEIFLLIAIAAHWPALSDVSRLTFAALAALALYMIGRSIQALQVLNRQNGDQLAVIDHVGFVLISLFDGFAIVTALNLNAPGWLVAAIAVGAVAVGIYGINLRKSHLAART